MKIEKELRWFICIFMLGFFVGIIYTNMIATKFITITNVFYENYFAQYSQSFVLTWDYIKCILKQRIYMIGILVIASYAKWKKIMATIFIVWTGFSGGVIAVTSVLRMGSAGMLICITALFPHFIFYYISFFLIIWHCYKYPKVVWNKSKIIIVAFIYLSGMVSEIYVNPFLMKALFKLLI